MSSFFATWTGYHSGTVGRTQVFTSDLAPWSQTLPFAISWTSLRQCSPALLAKTLSGCDSRGLPSFRAASELRVQLTAPRCRLQLCVFGSLLRDTCVGNNQLSLHGS